MIGKHRPVSPGVPAKKIARRNPALVSILLIGAAVLVIARSFLLLSEYEDTIRNLQNQVQQLDQQSTGQKSRYTRLMLRQKKLVQEYNALKDDYSSLEDRLNSSRQRNAPAFSTRNHLRNEFSSTAGQTSSSQDNSILAPSVTVSERKIYVTFLKLDQTPVKWVIPFEQLEKELQRGHNTRMGLLGLGMPTIRLTDDSGKNLIVADFRTFTDSTVFENVVADLYEQAPDDATFLRETWNLVGQLTAYEREIDEVPRFPLETLIGGGGDCEDMAILFASLIKAAPVSWDVKFVYLNSQNPLETQGISDHVIVFVDTGAEQHYIETTSDVNMEPYTQGVTGWYLPLK